MNKPGEIIELIQQQGMLPLYFYEDEQTCVNLLYALYNAGIKAVEFTNRGRNALQNFKRLKKLLTVS